MDHKTQKRLINAILNDDDNAVREIVDVCVESAYKSAVAKADQAFFEAIGTGAAQPM